MTMIGQYFPVRARYPRFNGPRGLRFFIARGVSRRVLARIRRRHRVSRRITCERPQTGSSWPRNKRVDENKVIERVMREGPCSLLTRGEATALIAMRTMHNRDDRRSARNRIGGQLRRSIDVSSDVATGGLSRRSDGRFTADEITRWAKRRYPGVFDDLPTKPREVFVHLTDTANAADSILQEFMPGDPEQRRRLIEQLRAKIRQLEAAYERREVERKRILHENLHRNKK